MNTSLYFTAKSADSCMPCANQEEADEIYQQLSDKLQKAVDLAEVKGAST